MAEPTVSRPLLAAVTAVDRNYALFGKGPCGEAVPVAPDLLNAIVGTAVRAYAESIARIIEREMQQRPLTDSAYRAGMGAAAKLLRSYG